MSYHMTPIATGDETDGGLSGYTSQSGIEDAKLGTLAIGAAAYHGYKRTRSAGWAAGWALAGAFFPIITIAVAVAQGFGKSE